MAAEGYLENKFDDSGNNLRFQVYRVPGLQRFPGQMLHMLSDSGIPRATKGLEMCSYLMGFTLRLLHGSNLAYMDGHTGNVSLVSAEKYRSLYITDLGSFMDFSSSRFGERFRGLDIWMYLESTKKLISLLERARHIQDSDAVLMFRSTSFYLTKGYFQKELEDYDDLTKKVSGTLLDYFLTKSHQTFLEFFEKYFRAITTL